eukprot:11112086-Lingulodinium_polyedra.AAC.1
MANSFAVFAGRATQWVRSESRQPEHLKERFVALDFCLGGAQWPPPIKNLTSPGQNKLPYTILS